jgi:hypothetical protein
MAVNLLLSFAFYAKDDMSKYRAMMPCGRLMVDSGAFTAHTIGQTISREEYAEFLTTWERHIDHAVTLDVIGDPKATRANTAWFHKRGIPVMPVFTRGDKPKDFDAMIRDSGYVCVGGGVGMRGDLLVRRLWSLQRRAEELGGGIHALGVGNLNGLRKIRPYSADASNVSSAFRFGNVIAYDGRRLHVFQHNLTAKVREHHHVLKSQGISVTELVRTGRQPTGLGRALLMRGMSVAYACADEDTTRFNVPVPHGVEDTPGMHMYSAVTGSHLAPSVAELDTLIHDGTWSVPMWERYRAHHARQCRATAQAKGRSA